jgi:hypothetical protein
MKKLFGLALFFAFLIFTTGTHAQTNALSVKFDQQTLTLLEKTNDGHWCETLASAFIGGIMAILAAWYAFNQQTKKEKDDGKNFNLRVVKAICCEVKTLQGVYDEGTGKFLKQHKAGEPFFRWMHISQQHFTIFESNAQHIAKIDGILAERIIIVYELMKLMVESFGVNSHYIKKLEDVASLLKTNSNDQQLLADQKIIWGQLIQQADIIKQLDTRLHSAADEMYRRIEELQK